MPVNTLKNPAIKVNKIHQGFMIDERTIDEVFMKVDILDVISQFVDLKRTGTTWRGLSPFGEEKTPSFYVVPSKNIYKDFSSGKGGNVINFLMEKQGYTYPEAIRWLCDHLRIEYREEKNVTPKQKEERQQASELLSYCLRKWQEQLKPNTSAWKELQERGLDDQTIAERGYGFAPMNYRFLAPSILERGLSKLAVYIGILREGKGSTYDAYAGRIIIPVYNNRGELVGFGGRILEEYKLNPDGEKRPKYINSTDSFMYSKSQELYGIDKARSAIRKLSKTYLVEGYFDVDAMHDGGLINTVASCGTGVTIEHLNLLKRLMERPCIAIMMDTDGPGVASCMSAVDKALGMGFKVEVVQLKDGCKDADDLRKQCLIADSVEEEA
jgi:DNA primase